MAAPPGFGGECVTKPMLCLTARYRDDTVRFPVSTGEARLGAGAENEFVKPNDNVSLPVSVLSGLTNTAYVEAWIFPLDTPGICPRRTIFRKRDHYNDFEMALASGGQLTCGALDPNTGGLAGAGGIWGAIPAAIWTKVGCWFDGTAMHGFINDIEVGQNGTVPFTPRWSFVRMEIGNDTYDTGVNCFDYGFYGDIDDVVISQTK